MFRGAKVNMTRAKRSLFSPPVAIALIAAVHPAVAVPN